MSYGISEQSLNIASSSDSGNIVKNCRENIFGPCVDTSEDDSLKATADGGKM